MKKAFVYGTATFGENFTNRVKETSRLVANFQNGINTILISPRRIGKTSLVRHVAAKVQSEQLKIVFIDIFACKSEEDFFTLYSKAVIQQTSSKWEEWVENSKKFLSNLMPKISFGIDPLQDFSIRLEMNKKSTIDAEYILNLPERIAQEKNIDIVLCVDEFQQIAEFKEAKIFQKKLRSSWQLHQRVSYCLFGSKRHLMTELFEKKSYPFYKFGDLMFLQNIDKQDFINYIVERFTVVNKTISITLAEKICDFTDCHSAYTQQLAWLVCSYTDKEATEDAFIDATDDLLNQITPFFQKEVEPLTSYQLNFLMAICNGVESQFYHQTVINEYQLGSTANVNKIIKSLLKREIINIEGKKVEIEDSIFKKWLIKNINPQNGILHT